MNASTLEELGLDVNRIRSDMNASFALAEASERRWKDLQEQASEPSDSNLARIAASYYRRAGSHALLLSDLELSRISFLGTTRMNDILNVPYGALVVSLSGFQYEHIGHVLNLLNRQADGIDFPESIRRQQVYLLLAYAADQESFDDVTQIVIKIRRDIEVYRSNPMGVLGIPLGVLLDIVDALAPQLASREIRPDEAFSPLIRIYSSALSSGMNNHYHWRRLAMPFHPAEPDIFGVLGLTKNRLQKRFNINLQQLFENFPMPKVSQVFLFGVFRDLPPPRNPQDYGFQ